MTKYSEQELPHIQGKYEKLKKSLSTNIDLIYNLLSDLNSSKHSENIEVIIIKIIKNFLV
jgi:hypothetical protein